MGGKQAKLSEGSSSKISKKPRSVSTPRQSLLHADYNSRHVSVKGKERIGPMYSIDLYGSDEPAIIEEHTPSSEGSEERLHFICDDGQYPAVEMISHVIRDAEICHLEALIKGYHIKKSTALHMLTQRNRTKKGGKNTMDIQYVVIAKVAIPESDLAISVVASPKQVATSLWESSIFSKYGTVVERWNLFAKRILKSYNPDEHWKMLCFFTSDLFKRDPKSVNALDHYHPWQNKHHWEDKVPIYPGRSDMTELYGIIGVYLRERVCERPDIYLTASRKYGVESLS